MQLQRVNHSKIQFEEFQVPSYGIYYVKVTTNCKRSLISSTVENEYAKIHDETSTSIKWPVAERERPPANGVHGGRGWGRELVAGAIVAVARGGSSRLNGPSPWEAPRRPFSLYNFNSRVDDFVLSAVCESARARHRKERSPARSPLFFFSFPPPSPIFFSLLFAFAIRAPLLANNCRPGPPGCSKPIEQKKSRTVSLTWSPPRVAECPIQSVSIADQMSTDFTFERSSVHCHWGSKLLRIVEITKFGYTTSIERSDLRWGRSQLCRALRVQKRLRGLLKHKNQKIQIF